LKLGRLRVAGLVGSQDGRKGVLVRAFDAYERGPVDHADVANTVELILKCAGWHSGMCDALSLGLGEPESGEGGKGLGGMSPLLLAAYYGNQRAIGVLLRAFDDCGLGLQHALAQTTVRVGGWGDAGGRQASLPVDYG
jgi:hypothetical protein